MKCPGIHGIWGVKESTPQARRHDDIKTMASCRSPWVSFPISEMGKLRFATDWLTVSVYRDEQRPGLVG